jgi:hypothetical protein
VLCGLLKIVAHLVLEGLRRYQWVPGWYAHRHYLPADPRDLIIFFKPVIQELVDGIQVHKVEAVSQSIVWLYNTVCTGYTWSPLTWIAFLCGSVPTSRSTT